MTIDHDVETKFPFSLSPRSHAHLPTLFRTIDQFGETFDERINIPWRDEVRTDSSMASRQPGMSVVTMGRPLAAASSSTFGTPSP